MTQPAGPLLVASKRDQASLNIAQNLIRHHGFQRQAFPSPREEYRKNQLRLLIIEKELIYTQPGDIPGNHTSIIFLSKHRSTTETPALTVHATGNLTNEAAYGGNPEEVSFVEPHRLQAALTTLDKRVKESNLRIPVTMEATHHGPTNFPVPVCFIEIGSGPSQYGDPVLGKIAAEAAIAATNPPQTRAKNTVGFGGTHYPAKHTKLCLDGTYLIGHIVSRYALEGGVQNKVLESTFKKTLKECKTALVDWKGLKGEDRRRLLNTLPSWNVEPVRT